MSHVQFVKKKKKNILRNHFNCTKKFTQCNNFPLYIIQLLFKYFSSSFCILINVKKAIVLHISDLDYYRSFDVIKVIVLIPGCLNLKMDQILHGNRADISKSCLLKSELRRFLGQVSQTEMNCASFTCAIFSPGCVATAWNVIPCLIRLLQVRCTSASAKAEVLILLLFDMQQYYVNEM